MATSLKLIALDAVKGFLDIREEVTTFDASLNALIDLATAEIEQETGRLFTSQAFVEDFDTAQTVTRVWDFGGSSPSGLTTRERPQNYRLVGIEIDSGIGLDVRYDPLLVFGDDTLILNLAGQPDYIINFETGLLELLTGTHAHRKALRVSYTAGYAQDGSTDILDPAEVPEMLRQACMFQVAFLRKRQRIDNIGTKTERGGGKVPVINFTTIKGLCPEATGLLRGFKRITVGRR